MTNVLLCAAVTSALGLPDSRTIEYAPTVMEVLMRREGLNQRQLAHRIRKDQCCISWYINRIKVPDERTAQRIADELNLNDVTLLLAVWNPSVDYTGTNNG